MICSYVRSAAKYTVHCDLARLIFAQAALILQ